MISCHTIRAKHGTILTYYCNKSGNKSGNKSTKRRPVIVLLHGLGSNHTRWSEFISHTTLTQKGDIIAPDLRGHGNSMARGRLTMDQWVQDLVDILHAEGHQTAIFAGHSLGAHIALFFAQRHPHMTRGIILIDPLSHENLSLTLMLVKRFRVIVYLIIYLIRTLNTLGLKRRQLPYRNLSDLDKIARQLLEQGKEQKMVALYSSIWIDLKFNATSNYFQSISQVLRPLPELGPTHAPALLLLSKSPVFSTADKQHALIRQLKNYTVNMIECNHWLLTEKPDVARQAIESWIEKEFHTTASDNNGKAVHG
ncbi:MAG: alpha/beta hydrolase [Gammaproteobacteria bacterium]|nr:alpha/beta hydrolase [Gammaproteobacteria bacterium]